jgi:hypothetical protein
MTEDEKFKVVNLLMILQIAVYAADETMNITWFNRHKTKAVSNNFLNIVLKEHGDIIKIFWDIPEISMPEITKVLDEYGKEAGSLQYEDIREVTALIKQYKQNKKSHDTGSK